MWPGRYIEALHHAVRQQPDGTLIDVTERPFPACRLSRTSLILDENQNYPFDVDPTVPSKFIILDNNKETAEYAAVTERRVRVMEEHKRLVKLIQGLPQQQIIEMNLEKKIRDLIAQAERLVLEKAQLAASMRLREPMHRGAKRAPCPCDSGLLFIECHDFFA